MVNQESPLTSQQRTCLNAEKANQTQSQRFSICVMLLTTALAKQRKFIMQCLKKPHKETNYQPENTAQFTTPTLLSCNSARINNYSTVPVDRNFNIYFKMIRIFGVLQMDYVIQTTTSFRFTRIFSEAAIGDMNAQYNFELFPQM